MEEKVYRIEVASGQAGARLDKFLAEKLAGKFSRAFLQKMILAGNVLVNGKSVKSHHRINGKDTVEVTVPGSSAPPVKGEPIPLGIVYEDGHLLVVNKPPGMVVHPAPANYTGTLVNAVLWHCKDLSGIGGVLKPGIVHRLDKGTSGLLVVAKTDEAHRGLAKQFKDKTIKRVYVALVDGVVELDNGIVELPIGRHVRDRKKMAVDMAGGRPSKTVYKVVRRFGDFTMLEVMPATGRTHQIRVHMSYIGHPLLGDDKYGTRGRLARPALHARTLGFTHPATGESLVFTSELPADLKEFISKAGR